MNTIIYAIIFIMGTVFGSFLTLAVYRVPLKQDILYTRSYCPNCNHRLEFLDLIPVLSYIFLGGKCRYCGKKIRIRYLIYEVLTGTLFVVLAASLRLNIYNLDVFPYINFAFISLYIVGVLLIAGINKEKNSISKPVVVYECIVTAMYMIYLYVVGMTSMYKYVIYLFILSILITLIQVILKYIINKIKTNKISIPTGFIFCYTNIALIIILNFISTWGLK